MLTDTPGGGQNWTPMVGHYSMLFDKHNVTGALEALTESEGRAIARFKSFDALRTRLVDEGRVFFARVDQETLPAHQVRLEPSELDLRRDFTPSEMAELLRHMILPRIKSVVTIQGTKGEFKR